MKKAFFAFIAVALIAVTSAFVTKPKVLDHKFHTVNATPFTYQSIQYIEVTDLTGLTQSSDYDCFESAAECTFESNEAAVVRDSKLSITKASWDNRGATVILGDFQP